MQTRPAGVPRLTAETLMQAARAATGLNDFGAEDFQTGLKMLLEEAQDSGLNAGGTASVQGMVMGALINRLRFESDLRQHPEILDEVIKPPLVITGLPRSGTTKLHRMIAADPHLQSIVAWQLMNPAPFPGGVDRQGRDPRIAIAKQLDAMLHELCPELLAGHPMQAEEVDEESSFLMEMGFEWILCAMRWNTPRYQAWVESRSAVPTYRLLRKLLQYLQWQSGDGERRPYVLKSPLHLDHLDALLEVFPDAVVVHTHREPKESVPSFMRLAELPRLLHYDKLDLEALGTWVLDTLAGQMQRNLVLRDRLGKQARIVDLAFRSVASDPLSGISTAYAQRGWTLSAQTQAAMLAWERGHPADRFGKFNYDMQHYGVTPALIDHAFAEYRERFGSLL